MNAIFQRIADYRRERRIRFLRRKAAQTAAEQGVVAAEPEYIALFDECDRRSPQQIARMERAELARMDPHARIVMEAKS